MRSCRQWRNNFETVSTTFHPRGGERLLIRRGAFRATSDPPQSPAGRARCSGRAASDPSRHGRRALSHNPRPCKYSEGALESPLRRHQRVQRLEQRFENLSTMLSPTNPEMGTNPECALKFVGVGLRGVDGLIIHLVDRISRPSVARRERRLGARGAMRSRAERATTRLPISLSG
jgi:hypothetical protein